MSLNSLLHFISSSGSVHQDDADLAFAEVDSNGRISSINPFGRLAWGWRTGSQLEGELLLALDGLSVDSPEAFSRLPRSYSGGDGMAGSGMPSTHLF